MLTLAQVKQSSVADVAGVNVQDPQFTQYVNDAVRMLMELGGNGGARGWWGTVQAVVGQSYGGYFVWPANVIAVLGIGSHHGEVQVANNWYSFVPPNGRHHGWARGWRGESVCEFLGQTCLFNSIAANPTQIIAIPDNVQDSGSTITIYGNDNYGKDVTSLQFDGTQNANTIQRGQVLTLGSAGQNVTASAMTTVVAVSKPITAGAVRLYAWTPSGGIGALLAIYNGGDVNPSFLYSRVLEHSTINQPITALVKLGFSGVLQDSDIVPLDNVDAIKSMVQSIRSRESGDHASGDAHERDALRRLIAQVNSRFPLEQFVVSFLPFGKRLRHDNLGMI